MPSVPSHKCFLFEKATGKTRLLIDSRGPTSSLQSTHAISQTDPALVLVRLLSQRFLIFNCRAIHLLAGVTGQAIHPRAQQGGICDVLPKIVVENRSAGIRRGRRDRALAGSRLA